MAEYKAAQQRCGSDEVVVGSTFVDGNGTSYEYYPLNGSHNTGPVIGGHYFCTNEEAESAGYTKYFLSD